MKRTLAWVTRVFLVWGVFSVVVWTGVAQLSWMELDTCSGIGIPKLVDFCGFALLCNRLYCPIFALTELLLFPLIGVEIISIALSMLANVQPVVPTQADNWGVVVVEGYLLLVALLVDIGIVYIRNRILRGRRNEREI